jgi:peptide chain release factor 2
MRCDRPCCKRGTIFDLPKKEARIVAIDELSGGAGFWTDQEGAQKVMQELKKLKAICNPWIKMGAELDELLELADLIRADDPLAKGDDAKQIESQIANLQQRMTELETRMMLAGPMDPNNAYIQIHAGAGGTESCDWASMLYRMYLRYCEREGYEVEEIDFQEGDETGIKGATLFVKGDFAYGYLRPETGVHRLVRISPFDSQSRRHTSFASVTVSPEVDDSINIEIEDKDIRIDVYRASGAGGQHVNRTESAVRITHLETNIVVQCQNERSQIKNRATAMKMLKARLYQHEVERRQALTDAANAQKSEIGWGHQIRSYVLHPYNMVKDLRTDYQTSNTTAVLDGDIQEFLDRYLRQTMGSTVS